MANDGYLPRSITHIQLSIPASARHGMGDLAPELAVDVLSFFSEAALTFAARRLWSPLRLTPATRLQGLTDTTGDQ